MCYELEDPILRSRSSMASKLACAAARSVSRKGVASDGSLRVSNSDFLGSAVPSGLRPWRMFSQALPGPSARRAARISSQRDFAAAAGGGRDVGAAASAACSGSDSPYGVSGNEISSESRRTRVAYRFPFEKAAAPLPLAPRTQKRAVALSVLSRASTRSCVLHSPSRARTRSRPPPSGNTGYARSGAGPSPRPRRRNTHRAPR